MSSRVSGLTVPLSVSVLSRVLSGTPWIPGSVKRETSVTQQTANHHVASIACVRTVPGTSPASATSIGSWMLIPRLAQVRRLLHSLCILTFIVSPPFEQRLLLTLPMPRLLSSKAQGCKDL